HDCKRLQAHHAVPVQESRPAAQSLRRSLLLRELQTDRQRADNASRGAVLPCGKPRASRGSEAFGLPHLPEPVSGEGRCNEAVRTLREISHARIPTEARSIPPSGNAADRPALTPSGKSSPILTRAPRLIVRVGVAVGLTGYMLWKSHPGEVLAAAKAA